MGRITTVAVLFAIALGPRAATKERSPNLSPAATAGPYRVSVVQIHQDRQTAQALDPDAEPFPPEEATLQNRLMLQLRVRGPIAVMPALDRVLESFAMEHETGSRVSASSQATTIQSDGVHVVLRTEAVPVAVARLRSLSGRVRAYPRGERARLRLELREGAEARHPTGLVVRVARFPVPDRQGYVELGADWPAKWSLRGEAESDRFTIGLDTGRSRITQRPSLSEAVVQAPPGRQAVRFEARAPVTLFAGQPPAHLIVEALLRTGEPFEHPFTLRDIRLPVDMASHPEPPVVRNGIPAQQRVRVNGKPAGIGTFEVGFAAARGTGWGPWRWTRLPTDAHGVAAFSLPGPGRYRIRRRWAPADPDSARRFAAVRWLGGTAEVEAVAGRSVAMAPLSAPSAPDLPTPAAAPARPEVFVPVGNGGYRLRVVGLRKRTSAQVNYLDEVTPGRVEASAMSFVDFDVIAPDLDGRAALANVSVHRVVTLDEEQPERSPDGFAARALGEETLVQRISVQCNNLQPDWAALREIAGELTAYDRAWVRTVDVPLPEVGDTEYRDRGFALTVSRREQGQRVTFTVRLRSPVHTRLSLATSDLGRGPMLLDERKQPARWPVIGTSRDREEPERAFYVVFVQSEVKPAFLRLRIVMRFGEPQTYPFRLRNIPLR